MKTLKKSAIREIDKDWKSYKKDLNNQTVNHSMWVRFKKFYTKAFKEKEEDKELTGTYRAKAKSAMDLADIKAELIDQATNISHLGKAFSTMANNN